MKRQMLVVSLIVGILLFTIGGVLVYAMFNASRSDLSPGGQRSSPTASSPQTPHSKDCGVTKASTGYAFSWLHVSGGYIMDDKNCIVILKGFNWSQLEFGNAVGGGLTTRISEQGIDWFSQTFHMNAWRIPLNAAWWNQNVMVPLEHMKYQDWIQQVVKWAEQHGNYVILTKGPQFLAPPCGGTVTLCPSQNQNRKNMMAGNASPEEQSTGRFIDAAITMWTSVARIYANDAAVLYDSWNEMHNIDPQTWYNSTNALIQAIRAQSPHSLIFLGGPNFKGNINPIIHGKVPDFTQSNLIYDFHVYNGFHGVYEGKKCQSPLSYLWKNWPDNANEQVGFSQYKGKAVAFSEWGGCNNLDHYNQAIVAFAREHRISLIYYDETNVAIREHGMYHLSANGLKVQAAYATF